MVTETWIYEGKAKVVFDSESHTYKIRVGDKVYKHPSVTTILKTLDKGDALLNWAANETANRMVQLATDLGPDQCIDHVGISGLADAARNTWRQTRSDAATIGTYVHDILSKVLEKKDWAYPELSPNQRWMIGPIKRAVSAGLEFIQKHEIEVVEVEKPRWSPTYGFVGTGDLIARIGGKLSVLDFKTGKGATYPEYYAQTGAYAIAYEEEHPGTHIEERWIVRVGKTGELDSATRRDPAHEGDRTAFLRALDLWRWRVGLQTRTSFSPPAGPIDLGALDTDPQYMVY